MDLCSSRIVLLTVWVSLSVARGMPETDLRSLLSLEPNQELIDHLGTRYEIVYPHQIRKDWARGLATHSVNGTATHIQETTLLIETLEYKLSLDLELNSKLFPPTLVQLLYSKDVSPVTVQKLPENCFYHATVRNYPQAKAAFQTCNGIRGVIYLEKRIFFIHPLYGNYSVKPPHFLFHYSPEAGFLCGNSEQEDEAEAVPEEDVLWQRSKYVELALVFDQSLLKLLKSPPNDALAAALEIVNHVDLLYRQLKTSVSLVYLEVWTEDAMPVGGNLSEVLEQFKEYAERKISRIFVDATHLLTGASFDPESNGLAYLDSICTSNAVGVTRIVNTFRPHVTAFVLAHMLGHNLGMGHDSSGCECASGESNCVMDGSVLMLDSTEFSSCSLRDYLRTLHNGYGACLYNMPNMRVSICGNSIQEENEQCDCGTAEECAKTNPCCDPTTCTLVQHAQCSSGPCCRKCKLLSPDHLCRPSKGECDIPEFCDGNSGECPSDLFKKKGAVCSEGLGYCYRGTCPVLKTQCEEIWGRDADVADSICFERLNVQGTPNGNCGVDERGEIAKCTEENSYCGFLQCSHGEKTPLYLDKTPIHFVVHKINFQGTVYECKARTFSGPDLREGLVKEGTKCGYHKLCINQTCTSLKNLVSGKCPEDCSEHGICTNINSCFCDEGWKGEDCSLIDEDAARERELYYDIVEGEGSAYENAYYGENEMKVNPNLAITVIAAFVVIGVGLVIIVILLFFYRYKSEKAYIVPSHRVSLMCH